MRASYTLLWLHQGFQTVCGTCSASWECGGVFGGLHGFFVFLGADQTQNGFVEELVLILSKKLRRFFHLFLFGSMDEMD